MGDVWRRYWPLHLVAVGFFVVVLIFARYLEARQHAAEARDERTRLSLCAILDRIPEHIDSGMDKARTLDRCGAPHPPTVFFGRPFPRPTVIVRPQPTVTAAPSPAATATVTARPSVSPTPTRTPSPQRSPSPTPTPSPSRSGVCLPVICH